MEKIRRGWQTWKRFATFIGDWIGRVVLSIFYFTLLVPFGLGVRLWSDPLTMKHGHGPGWTTRETPDTTLERGRRQF